MKKEKTKLERIFQMRVIKSKREDKSSSYNTSEGEQDQIKLYSHGSEFEFTNFNPRDEKKNILLREERITFLLGKEEKLQNFKF